MGCHLIRSGLHTLAPAPIGEIFAVRGLTPWGDYRYLYGKARQV